MISQGKLLKILFVTNNYTPYTGGVVRSIQATHAALTALGHEVRVVTLDFVGASADDPLYVYRIPCPLKFRYRTNHMAVPWRASAHITKIIKEWRPDVVHVHHPFLLGPIAHKSAQSLGVPIAFTYHTLYEQYAHYIPLPTRLTQPIITAQVRAFCRRVDAVIAPSSTVAHTLDGIKKSVVCIPSGLRNLFMTQSNTIKKMGTPVHLLVVSRFTKEKNITFIFDVCAQLPANQFKLTLVGYGHLYDTLQHMAYVQYGFSRESVCFVHKPSQDVLLNYYQNTDLFLFSSVTDTQGLVLAEAMSCGTPVVAIDGPGQRDIVCNGKNGFIVRNVAGMVQAIQTIANNAQLYATLSAGAYKTAMRYYPDQIAQRLVGVYRDLV